MQPPTGPEDQSKEQAIIVWFHSEQLRNEVYYRFRFKLKIIQQQHPEKRVFVNEDVTTRSAGLAIEMGALKIEHKDGWQRSAKPHLTC